MVKSLDFILSAMESRGRVGRAGALKCGSDKFELQFK